MAWTWAGIDKSLLQTQFAADVEQLLTPSAYNWEARAGFRSYAEQEALYKIYQSGGPKAAPPGTSAHEFGLAVDVGLLVDGVLNWDYKNDSWRWLVEAVGQSHRLHSLDNIGDTDHIERYEWWMYKVEV